MFIPRRVLVRSFLSVFGIAWLVYSMNVGCLIASPQRPYIHEIFGPELILSWPDGQKLHEEVMELYYAGNYTAATEKLDKAIADAEQFSKTREKDLAVLLTTKAQGLFLLGATKDAEALLLRAQHLADQVLDAKNPVAGRIQFVRSAIFFVRGDLPSAKLALERSCHGYSLAD